METDPEITYDSDLESDLENNVPPRGMDPEFCRRIQNMKWKLYESIVLGPETETDNAQNNQLIQIYVNTLEKLYRFLERAQHGGVVERDLLSFPAEMRSENLSVANWVKNYFKKNGPIDTIPYSDYLNTTLRVYPFIHHKRMVGGELFDSVEDM
jgi:hypothetical protein